MSKIQFIEESHTYILDGVILPSVSQIIADDTYLSIPPHILENAAKRGTAVHLASEMIDLGKKPRLDSSFAEWVCQFLLYKKEMNEHIFDEIENIVYNDEFAGTLDRFGWVNGNATLIDVKTTSKLYKEKIALQLGGYAILHSHLNFDKLGWKAEDYKGGVIWLTKNSWKYVEIEPNVDGFLQKLAEYKSKEVASETNW